MENSVLYLFILFLKIPSHDHHYVSWPIPCNSQLEIYLLPFFTCFIFVLFVCFFSYNHFNVVYLRVPSHCQQNYPSERKCCSCPLEAVYCFFIHYISQRNAFRGQKSLESSKRVEAWNKLWSPSWMPKGAWNSCNSLELFSRDSTYSNIKARPTLESENVSRWEHCVIFSKKKISQKRKVCQ